MLFVSIMIQIALFANNLFSVETLTGLKLVIHNIVLYITMQTGHSMTFVITQVADRKYNAQVKNYRLDRNWIAISYHTTEWFSNVYAVESWITLGMSR